MKHIVTIVGIICLTVIAGLALYAGGEEAIVISSLSIIGVLSGYLSRRNANNIQA